VIETIYSNESGEGNLSNRMQTSFKMPKNIRQIGKSGVNKRIYVEDYVMTYIKQLAGGDYSSSKYGVLVGQCIKQENCRNIFISGAVEINNIETSNDIVFSNDTWTGIYESIKKYFVESEIVGWFIGGPGYLIDDMEKIRKAHVDNFAGQDKTLLSFDIVEKEEAFWGYENSRLMKQEGYYIYYEKNEEMQTYMIDHKNASSNEADYDDRVSRDIRAVIKKNKPIQEENKNVGKLVYAASTLLALIVLVIAAAILNNYDQMQKMQDTISYLSQNMEEVQSLFVEGYSSAEQQGAQVSDTDISGEASEDQLQEESLNVEVVPGDVTPQEDTEAKEDDGEKKENNTSEELAQESKSEDNLEVETTDDQEAGQKEVSNNTQEAAKYYTVQSGDTLAGISFKLYGTYTKVSKIMELNSIVNKDYIFVGQKLIIP